MFDDFIRGPGLPFHFWSMVFIIVGAIVGSFLNVCIHRMPRGESLVTPGSHCPQCDRAIPLRLNVPVISWLWLRGRCAFCGAAIPVRYLLVELLTSGLFLGCWLAFGRQSWALALVYAVFAAGLVVATFVDFEHYIIPDAITLGGVGVGLIASFLVPELHRGASPSAALARGLFGAALGGAVIYGVLRLGKLLFGRQRVRLEPGSRVVFGEYELFLPDRVVAYEEVFYRDSDAVAFVARRVELADRCFWDQPIRMSKAKLRIGEEEFVTEQVPGFEAVTDTLTLPREALGLGDVKFMAAIGAFLGWRGVVFTLFASAVLGSLVGTLLILLRRHDRSRPVQYGPYIAAAALVWVFGATQFSLLLRWWLSR